MRCPNGSKPASPRGWATPPTTRTGTPIPTVRGEVHTRAERRLSQLAPGEAATVARVPDGDPAGLRAPVAAGLTPGAALTLTRVDAALGTLTVTLVGGPLTLALGVAAQVQVHGGAE